MAKISRKIVQAIAGVGKKGLVNLERVFDNVDQAKWMLESKAKNSIDRTKSKARNYYRNTIKPIMGDAETASRNLVDIGVLKTTKVLLDKKIITPSQAKRINDVVESSHWDSRPFYYGPRTYNLKTNQIRRELRDSLPSLTSDFEGRIGRFKEGPDGRFRNYHSDKATPSEKRAYNKFINENYDRLVQFRRRTDKKNDAIERLARRYINTREMALKLGAAGLIGAGVAGAKALAPKEESKNKSSDVKKMANRSNKYFS